MMCTKYIEDSFIPGTVYIPKRIFIADKAKSIHGCILLHNLSKYESVYVKIVGDCKNGQKTLFEKEVTCDNFSHSTYILVDIRNIDCSNINILSATSLVSTSCYGEFYLTIDQKDSLRIAFSGSRYRHEKEKIRDILETYIEKYGKEYMEVVHGACPYGGIDSDVDEICKELELKVKVFKPERNERKYFLQRNIEMAKYADVLYAFPRDYKNGLKALMGEITRGGTEHTIRQFVKLRKEVHVL